jgi:hypothetical protein
MAIESDISNPDSRLAVKFYKRPVKLENESIAQGRPIFQEFDFIKILVPGDALTEIDTYVTEAHKTRFPIQWANYMNRQGSEESYSGTPLSEWPQISASQAEELKGIKFHTVEAIAHASDLQLQKIGMISGMSPHNFRERAKKFLNLAEESAQVSKRDEELAQLREENAKIKAETEAKLSQMQEQMAALLSAVGEKKPKTRKTKVVEEA